MDIAKIIDKKRPFLIHTLSIFLFFYLLCTLFFIRLDVSERISGDVFAFYFPNFHSPRSLWTNLLLSGFPSLADPQFQVWYPIALLFSHFSDAWSSFNSLAYALASCFAYGYVYTLTNSRLAALIGGMTYGMSGFMITYYGYTTIIHAALWIPLLIWSLEKLRHQLSAGWLIIGTFAVACLVLAGHPQISFYGLSLSACYGFCLGWSAPIGRWRYYRFSCIATCLGLGLATIQLLPTIEFASLSVRSKMSFADFVSHSLPLGQVIQLIFPFYQPPPFNGLGLFGYVGLLPLLLCVIGILTHRDRAMVWFWSGFGLFAFLLVFGDDTPLAYLMYHLPVYNKFRAPVRHFVEVSLAVSVLAGFAVSALQKQRVSHRLLVKLILVSTGVILISSITTLFISQISLSDSLSELFNHLQLLKFSVGLPLLLFFATVTLLIYFSKTPQSNLRSFLLVLILIIDFGSFVGLGHYQFPDIYKHEDSLIPTPATQRYRELLTNSKQRMLPTRGVMGTYKGTLDEIPPNTSRFWGIPSASGYGPLILSRYHKLLSIDSMGVVPDSLLEGVDRSLDITAVRYIFRPTVLENNPAPDADNNLNVSLGSSCGVSSPKRIKLKVPAQPKAATLRVVSALACSGDIPDNTEVLRISVTDVNGNVETQSLQTGRDTSEWAYDCSDVRSQIQHQRATIFESFPIVRENFPTCKGHNYVSVLPLENLKLKPIDSVQIEWTAQSGAISIHKLSLDDASGRSHPITNISSFLDDTSRWRHLEDLNQTSSVYENLRAMPRAWLVPEVITAKSKEILKAIKTSQLPDGRSYDPAQTALIEEPLNFKPQTLDPSATAEVVNLSDTHIEVQANTSSPAFLVLSDIAYPGWQATLDGKPVHLFQTNYVLRGVAVPPGLHNVRFEFKPLTLHLGAGISAACLGLLGYFSFKLNRYSD